MRRFPAVILLALVIAGPVSVEARPLGTQVPSNCVPHSTFNGGVDFAGDYRCAGLAIEFHTAGVAFSPGPTWAGQWLFVDEAGQFRVGSCTFNRGVHPTIDVPSSVVAQMFPNDPTGAKGAYLTWRYGDSTDNLTAAAMWAVFHYYAQDAAGTNRAANGWAPLVPALDVVARSSGRDDIQALAMALDAEAVRLAGEWTLTATVDVGGHIETRLAAADQQPVADATITLLLSGQDAPIAVRTDSDGVARSTMLVAAGTMTVVATTAAAGPAVVYRGTPAGPDPQGAQSLVTAGVPRILSATTTVDVPAPTTTFTTTTTTTTTVPPPTTTPTTNVPPTTTTTTTVPSTTATSTTTTTSTTLPPATTTSTTATPPVPTTVELVASTDAPGTTPPPTAATAEALPPPPGPALPKAGKGSGLISYLGTSLLVAGIGIVGVAGRRR